MDTPGTIDTDRLSSDPVESAADRLVEAGKGQPCSPIRDLLPQDDLDAAYAVQDLNTWRAVTSGRRLVGCKIGLTSPEVQRQLGVHQPDFGMLFADMAVGEGNPVPAGRVLQPRIEAEVALVLERDLDVEQPTLADLLRATAYAVPALEIVGSRIRNWDIRIVDTIADNASSGLFVLGGPARKLDGLDLRGAAMVMHRGEEIVSKGSGAQCMGHPLNAAVWLAAEMSRRGRPLRAGDTVLTGALGPMVPVRPGDDFRAQVEGLGTVAVSFSEEV